MVAMYLKKPLSFLIAPLVSCACFISANASADPNDHIAIQNVRYLESTIVVTKNKAGDLIIVRLNRDGTPSSEFGTGGHITIPIETTPQHSDNRKLGMLL